MRHSNLSNSSLLEKKGLSSERLCLAVGDFGATGLQEANMHHVLGCTHPESHPQFCSQVTFQAILKSLVLNSNSSVGAVQLENEGLLPEFFIVFAIMIYYEQFTVVFPNLYCDGDFLQATKRACPQSPTEILWMTAVFSTSLLAQLVATMKQELNNLPKLMSKYWFGGWWTCRTYSYSPVLHATPQSSNTNSMPHSHINVAYQVSRKLIASVPNGDLLDIALNQTPKNSQLGSFGVSQG